MKHCNVILLLLSIIPCFAHATEYQELYGEQCEQCATTVFLPRPQGLNSAVGLNSPAFFDPWYYPCCDNKVDRCWTWNLGFRYDQTFKGKHLAQCLFGADKEGVLKFAGSQATAAQQTNALLADDYGLAPNSYGSVSFDPSIKNYNVDFFIRFEWGSVRDYLEGLYTSLNTTLTHSVWDLGYKKLNWNAGSTTLPLCMQGRSAQSSVEDITTALEGYATFGELATASKYGHFVINRAQKLTKLANIDCLVGYDFVRNEAGHFGMFFKTVAPTGNQPNPATVFSPVIGNAHHWEFGAGIDGHWDIWCCDDNCFSLLVTGAITHLFNDKQLRTFDTNHCCMSRNQLLKKLDAVYANGIVNNYVFTENLVAGTDWTTRLINSAFSVQGDASAQLMYRTCGWAFGVGYNVYGRSEESIEMLPGNLNKNGAWNVATKGTTGVCYTKTTITPPATTYPALNASQDKICTKDFNKNTPVDQVALELESIPGGAQYTSWNVQSPTVYESVLPNGTVDSFTPNPTPLNETNIDYFGVPRQIQHTIFGNVTYEWRDCGHEPFVGIGGMCSFANNGNCDVCTASQWGLWIHGGWNF
jgi:hypothetical protein